VRLRLAFALAMGLVLASTSLAKGVDASRSPIALSVSPAHVALAAPGSRAIRLRNVGARQVLVETARGALGPRRSANLSVSIVPARLVLRAGSSTRFTLRVAPRRHAAPGDHHVLVLLTARPVAAARVAVRMRLGVVVRVRVPGRIVRRVELQGLRVRRHGDARVLLASVANRGNVSEELRSRVTISLSRRGHAFARLHALARRELRPGTRAIFRARYAGRVRGVVTAIVSVRMARSPRALERGYRIRL
jgi:hypothetical protein